MVLSSGSSRHFHFLSLSDFELNENYFQNDTPDAELLFENIVLDEIFFFEELSRIVIGLCCLSTCYYTLYSLLWRHNKSSCCKSLIWIWIWIRIWIWYWRIEKINKNISTPTLQCQMWRMIKFSHWQLNQLKLNQVSNGRLWLVNSIIRMLLIGCSGTRGATFWEP